jgi:hypothetical protein
MKGYSLGAGGLFIPENLTPKMGIGCPKCDQHFLQDTKLGQSTTEAQTFIRKHMHCGPLDALETRDGKVFCTGPVILKMAPTRSD